MRLLFVEDILKETRNLVLTAIQFFVICIEFVHLLSLVDLGSIVFVRVKPGAYLSQETAVENKKDGGGNCFLVVSYSVL